MGYFGKRFAYDLAKAHARDKQAKKKAKEKAKIDKEKAKEKARIQAQKEQEKAEKERIKAQEKAERERIKAEAKAEKDLQEKEKALLKVESLQMKFEADMQQAQDIFEYLQSKEQFMLKYVETDWLVEQIIEHGVEKASKPLQALVKKCDALIKKLDTINNEIIQLMAIRNKHATQVAIDLDDWRFTYKELMTFSNTIKASLLQIIDCMEQIEQQM